MPSDAAPAGDLQPSTPNTSRRISLLGGSLPLNTKKSQRKLQVRSSHSNLAQQLQQQHQSTQNLRSAEDAVAMRRTSVQPTPKKSRSSLFDLFSKPKVEKARAYGGESISTPVLPRPAPQRYPANQPSALKSNPPDRTTPTLSTPPTFNQPATLPPAVKLTDSISKRASAQPLSYHPPQRESIQRPPQRTSIQQPLQRAPTQPLSQRASIQRLTQQISVQPATHQTSAQPSPNRASVQPNPSFQPQPRPVPYRVHSQAEATEQTPNADDTVRFRRSEKNASWTPPPLFQAFARSLKHGLAETSIASADKNAARLRAAAREKELEEQAAGRKSLELDVSEGLQRAKMTVHAARGLSSTHVELSRNIVVLLDDGHLLQYSPHGSTNRLPEKVLQLGADSAAFVSDISAHSHGALRIVQSTGSKSFSLQNTVSALSRLTRRSANQKREVQNLLFVFRDSTEMNDWLHVTRKYIDSLSRPDSISSEDTAEQVDSVIDDNKSIEKPKAASAKQRTEFTALPSMPPHVMNPLVEPQTATFHDDSDDSDRKGSLEILEEEVDKLAEKTPMRLSLASANNRISDAPSFTSSGTPSMDAQTLTNLRNSVRMSHISSRTSMTSRTNSTSSEHYTKSSPENGLENGVVKSPYRTLHSKRRSGMPLTSNPTIEVRTPSTQVQAPLESPLLGSYSNMPMQTPSTSRSSIIQSSPAPIDTRGSDQLAQQRTPTITEEDERPESIVADLPPPSTWTKVSPKKRNSTISPPMADRQQYRYSSAPLTQTPQQAAASANRRASHGFRIPLKINPAVPSPQSASRIGKSESDVPEVLPGAPQVVTLEAKVDPKTQRMSVGNQTYSTTELRQRASQRLSLFPSPLLSQSPIPEQALSRQPPESIPARRTSLQRPTSLQVRSDPAPFLSSVRNSKDTSPNLSNDRSPPSPPIASTSPPASTAIPLRAAPIRQLKPSRSASAISSMATVREYGRPASPTDPFTSGRALIRDEYNDGLQLPPRRQSLAIRPTHSYAPTSGASTARLSYVPSGSGPPAGPLPMAPLPIMGNSFAQQKAMHPLHRTSMRPVRQSYAAPMQLSSLDMDDLGPPAPPPSAPLPAPPDGAPPGISLRGSGPSRTSSRMSMQAPNGLGIRV